MRLRVPAGYVSLVDRVHGALRVDVAAEAGDFVLRRGDGIFAYQLAVVVDDIDMEITQVVRGADLLGSTARQILLATLLGARPPEFAHSPLVLAPDGARLAKRAHGVSVRDHRAMGVRSDQMIALLARILGLATSDAARLMPIDLVTEFAWDRIRRDPVRVDPERLCVV